MVRFDAQKNRSIYHRNVRHGIFGTHWIGACFLEQCYQPKEEKSYNPIEPWKPFIESHGWVVKTKSEHKKVDSAYWIEKSFEFWESETSKSGSSESDSSAIE